MKITQIVSEDVKQPTNEAPVGGIKQGLTKLGAKVAAKVGAKNTAMGLAGKADTGDEANELRGEFQNYMGSTGQSIGKFNTGELRNWLKSKKLPTTVVPQADMDIGKKELDDILLKTVQQSKRVGGGASGATDPNVKANPNVKNDPVVQKQNGQATIKQNGSVTGPATAVPPAIQAQLDLLNAPDKKRLAAMI